MQFIIRKAVLHDCQVIEELIKLSARGLSTNDYTPDQVEDALQGAFGVDTQLIKDGTYFVVEDEGVMIGCGGWSRRKTLFGGDKEGSRNPEELDPEIDPAKIRAFFVHPDWVRKGVGKMIFEKCESESRIYGFKSLELMSTLPGIKFYQSCGFKGGDYVEYKLPSGINITFLPMRKKL